MNTYDKEGVKYLLEDYDLRKYIESGDWDSFWEVVFTGMNCVDGIRVMSAIGEAGINCKLEIIPEHCFEGAGWSGEVTIPKSVKRIETQAFRDSDITAINGLENVEYIGPRAFYNTDLHRLTIENKNVKIGLKAFLGSVPAQYFENVTLPKKFCASDELERIGFFSKYSKDGFLDRVYSLVHWV